MLNHIWRVRSVRVILYIKGGNKQSRRGDTELKTQTNSHLSILHLDTKSHTHTGGAKARPPWAAGRAPMVQQRREERGRCVHRVAGRSAEDGGEGARRLARGGRGSRHRRSRAWEWGKSSRSRRCGAEDMAVRGLSAPK